MYSIMAYKVAKTLPSATCIVLWLTRSPRRSLHVPPPEINIVCNRTRWLVYRVRVITKITRTRCRRGSVIIRIIEYTALHTHAHTHSGSHSGPPRVTSLCSSIMSRVTQVWLVLHNGGDEQIATL